MLIIIIINNNGNSSHGYRFKTDVKNKVNFFASPLQSVLSCLILLMAWSAGLASQ